MGIANYLKKRLWDEEWNVAIRPHAEAGVLDTDREFRVLSNTWRYWCADPFAIEWQGKTYVFMEVLDRFTQKGSIAYRRIENGKAGPIRICIDTPHHMSYPMLYTVGDEIFMIPECHKSGNLTAYRAVQFPDVWEPVQTILPDRMVCDTNYLRKDGKEYLLTMPIDGERYIYDTLELYCRETDGDWKLCVGSPFVPGTDRARNGGNFFSAEGMLIRPSQNCGTSYGEKLVLNQVREISPNGYREETLREITAGDIRVDSGRYDGIHTFNHSEAYDVIDLRRRQTFQSAKLIYLIRHKLGL